MVKNPGEILSEEYFEKYIFKFAGFATIDGRDNYVIEFDQRPDVELPLYKGTIYLDTKNLAFSRMDFSFSDKALEIADNELVRKKPMDLKIDVLAADYMINYRVVDEKWYLNHVRSELVFKCNWKKKRYNATYTTALEMAVTDRNTETSTKPDTEISLKRPIFLPIRLMLTRMKISGANTITSNPKNQSKPSLISSTKNSGGNPLKGMSKLYDHHPRMAC